MVEAVTIESDVEVGGYIGANTPHLTGIDVDEVAINDIDENLTILEVKGYGGDMECWSNHSGVYVEGDGVNGVLCRVNLADSGDKLFIFNVVNYTENITLLNQSGDAGSYAFRYNSTAGGSISLYQLTNKSGQCNYGVGNLTGRNLKAVQFPFNNTIYFRDCNVTLYLNSSVQNDVWAAMAEDNSVSNLALASAVAGLVTLILYKAYQWDTVT